MIMKMGMMMEEEDARQLLVMCGDLICGGPPEDDVAAQRLLSAVSARASRFGDAKERLLHHFWVALTRRINKDIVDGEEEGDSQLTMNQVTPFLRFAHLTANQSILDSIRDGDQSLHVVDLDIMHGLQWPPLMQALADRTPNPSPLLKITAAGTDPILLARTGDRLRRFAVSLGLPFRFHPLVLPPRHDPASIPALLAQSCVAGEPLAINCVLFLHRLLDSRGDRPLARFLQGARELSPRVVAVAEREAELPMFSEAVDHFAAIFDSLEATLPSGSRERVAVEEAWLSREIGMAVKGSLRSRRYSWWEAAMRRSGFSESGHSPFAVSQAKLLLRLHYPSEGYQLHLGSSSLSIAWQNRPLFAVSSWHAT